MSAYLREVAGGVELEVLVVPRSSKNRIAGEHDGRLKVQLNAPPLEGEANAALLQLMAKTFGLRKKDVELVSGETGRRKRVRLNGMSAAEVERALSERES